MEKTEIEQRIASHLPSAEFEVDGQDCDFTLTLIADDFAELSKLQRQQMVLGWFADVLSTGELHALTVLPFTFAEFDQQPRNLVQISL
ncbi:MAG: BolA/IbaG family iron-sulfur metabolism protein [Pseudomonadales bacterium]|nr:BolA/IbaG family iron-sulfur metabolism protein [Pseudomonadales bacterium]